MPLRKQRERLQAVYAFLKEHDVDAELLNTIEEAFIDLEMRTGDRLLGSVLPAESSVV